MYSTRIVFFFLNLYRRLKNGRGSDIYSQTLELYLSHTTVCFSLMLLQKKSNPKTKHSILQFNPKALSEIVVDDILNCFHHFSEKLKLGISCESSARQTIDMKSQALFSLKTYKKKYRRLQLRFALIKSQWTLFYFKTIPRLHLIKRNVRGYAQTIVDDIRELNLSCLLAQPKWRPA